MLIPYRLRPTWTFAVGNTLGRLNLDPLARSLNVVSAWIQFSRWCWVHRLAGDRHGPDRTALYETIVQAENLQTTPLTYLEFGVYKGWSLKWWVNQIRHPDSRFVGFDTFTGLPENWHLRCSAGTFDAQGILPDVADSRCSFQVGLFQDSLPRFLEQNDCSTRLVVHLDADLFTSTLFVLTQLAPKLKSGDILIFDELSFPVDEFRAFEYFVKSFRIKYEVLGAGNGYMWVAVKIL